MEARFPRRGIAWIVFYLLFVFYAAADHSGFLIIDYVNLIIHEGGHFFFGWFGHTIMILGGTPGELIVPLLGCVYFWWHRETTAVAFCSFWYFENFLYIGDVHGRRPHVRIAVGWLRGQRLENSIHSMGSSRPRPTNRSHYARPRLDRHSRHGGLARVPRLEQRSEEILYQANSEMDWFVGNRAPINIRHR